MGLPHLQSPHPGPLPPAVAVGPAIADHVASTAQHPTCKRPHRDPLPPAGTGERADLPGVLHEHRVVTVAKAPRAIRRIGKPYVSLRAELRFASLGAAIPRLAAAWLRGPIARPGAMDDMVRWKRSDALFLCPLTRPGLMGGSAIADHTVPPPCLTRLLITYRRWWSTGRQAAYGPLLRTTRSRPRA